MTIRIEGQRGDLWEKNLAPSRKGDGLLNLGLARRKNGGAKQNAKSCEKEKKNSKPGLGNYYRERKTSRCARNCSDRPNTKGWVSGYPKFGPI